MTAVSFVSDFAVALTELGFSFTRTSVTETNGNGTGDQSNSEGTDHNITVVLKNPGYTLLIKKKGEEKGASIQCFSAAATTINKEDKITWQTLKFRVKAISTRYSADVAIFKKIDLELI